MDKFPISKPALRLYLQQKSQMYLTNDRHAEYTAEIWSRLGNNMQETMDFLEE